MFHKGRLLRYFLAPHMYQLEMHNSGRFPMRVRTGRKKIYTAASAKSVHQVFLTDANKFKKGVTLQKLKDLFPLNIFSAEGSDHLKLRKSLSKVFSKSYMARFENSIEEYMNQKLLELDDEFEVDLQAFFDEISMDIISILLFGKRLPAESKSVKSAANFAAKMLAFMHIPGYKYLLKLPLPIKYKYQAAQKELASVISKLIQNRTKDESKHYGTIDVMINEGFTEEEIFNQVVILFLAGHETTASALAWLFYEVLKEDLYEGELKKNTEMACLDNISYTEGDKIVPLKALIYETLRLYPTAWNIGREVSEDLVVDGLSLKKGEYLTISPFVLHRSSLYYIEPEKFNYKRWINSDKSFKVAQKYTYIPFGLGQRNCLGKILAETEMYTVTKKILSSFDIELLSKGPVKFNIGPTLKPSKEILARFKKNN